jgi:hypothetical protein
MRVAKNAALLLYLLESLEVFLPLLGRKLRSSTKLALDIILMSYFQIKTVTLILVRDYRNFKMDKVLHRKALVIWVHPHPDRCTKSRGKNNNP